MKKLITSTFAITVLMLGAIGIQAQSKRSQQKTNHFPKAKVSYKTSKINNKRAYNNRNSRYNGGFTFRGTYTYYTTKYIRKFGKRFENTYEVKLRRNGRKTTKLVKRVLVKRNHSAKTTYKTKTVKRGNKFFRITHKVSHFGNGRTKKVQIKKVRVNTHFIKKRNRTNW